MFKNNMLSKGRTIKHVHISIYLFLPTKIIQYRPKTIKLQITHNLMISVRGSYLKQENIQLYWITKSTFT